MGTDTYIAASQGPAVNEHLTVIFYAFIVPVAAVAAASPQAVGG